MRSTDAAAATQTGGAEYLPLKSLSVYSGLSVRTLRARLTDLLRPLPHYRVGGKILIRRSEFDAWLQQFRNQQEQSDLGNVVDDIVSAFRGKV